MKPIGSNLRCFAGKSDAGNVIRSAIITYTDIFVEVQMTVIKAERIMTLSVDLHKRVS